MDSSVLVALIAAGSSVLAVVITTIASHMDITQKLDKQQAVFEAIVNEKIESLKKDVARLEVKQDKHNAVIDRTAELEKTVALNTADIKHLDEKIDKLGG